MPVIAPPTLTPAGLSPDRADRPTFVARSIARDEFIKNTQIPELQIAIDNVYSNSLIAYESGTTASALAAAQAAPVWVSGTTYSLGYVVWSPITFIAYRRIIAGAGTTDPSVDVTNWAAIITTITAGGSGASTAAGARLAYDVPSNAELLLASPVGSTQGFPMSKAPTGWLKANGANISRTSYAALFAYLVQSATSTMTIASPSVVTWTAHELSANDPVKFSTTGALPTGFVAGTTYYVVSASITTNTFQLSATAGGAAINTTGTQSGVHTAIHAPYGTGDGSTTFTLPDLRGDFVRGLDDGRGVDASRSIGSFQADDFKSHTHLANHTFSTAGASGGAVNVQTGVSATGATGGTETRPRNTALLFCIKY
jgi:microcystin-dependent protein